MTIKLPNITSGGWNRNIPPARKYTTIFAGRNTHVCHLSSDNTKTDTELEANADAIAALPDLLSALAKCYKDGITGNLRDQIAALADARNALLKSGATIED